MCIKLMPLQLVNGFPAMSDDLYQIFVIIRTDGFMCSTRRGEETNITTRSELIVLINTYLYLFTVVKNLTLQNIDVESGNKLT